MIELDELEAHHAEFDKRNARVIVVSLEDEKDAQATQKDFPHLVVVADKERNLAKALQVIHRRSAPDGGDSAAPTTLLVDGSGIVRWTFRPDTFFRRLSVTEIAEAVDEHMGGDAARKGVRNRFSLQQTAAAYLVPRDFKAQRAAAAAELLGYHFCSREPTFRPRRISMPTEEQEESHRAFEIRSSIPVLRMFDEAKAKAF